MAPLVVALRRLLEKKVVEARDAAEAAAAAALKALAVDRTEPFPSMTEEQRQLRRLLRAGARQLGSFADPLESSEGFALLASEIAYEQWHRMLFARFLAENGLLIHPEHGIPVTLAECAELAPSEGEPDEWMLAARYASEMLPGIFRTDDPTLSVRFAPEGRQALERILAELPAEIFTADDSLGWVYQFWQSKQSEAVRKSERKIGGADLPPVTQFFTEHYMVAFLLENSLGAWWAGKRPGSPLLADWEYLRFAEDGAPAAGTFDGWPATAAEVTMMDPCCGSGHFLVAGFEMLRKMREEEEGLSPREAADAVLRDNLLGLELDGRCVQIAVFALALAAWKVGGYRELPQMNVACSGVPARGKVAEWRRLAQGDNRLADALERLHYLFKDADTLGSLIDPRRAAEADTLLGVDYEDVAPLLHGALARYGGDDPAQQVFAQAAEDVATAAKLLAGTYTLVATNVPYLSMRGQSELLQQHVRVHLHQGRNDLAAAMLLRSGVMSSAVVVVAPSALVYKTGYRETLDTMRGTSRFALLADLGTGAFSEISGEVVDVVLVAALAGKTGSELEINVRAERGSTDKAVRLRAGILEPARFASSSGSHLADVVQVPQGIKTGDDFKWVRHFWELQGLDGWERLQGTGDGRSLFSGRERIIDWRSEGREMIRPRLDSVALGRTGPAVSQTGSNSVVIFTGDRFDSGIAPVVPATPKVSAECLVAYCTSAEYLVALAGRVPGMHATNSAVVDVPFDLEHWTKVAAEKYPNGLPEPHSDDPTQWLFEGNIAGSESPLHVAAARLLGYSWPDQEPDEVDRFSDPDGIVCLPPIGGERPAADRLLELLAAAYGSDWSQSVLQKLLAPEGASDLETWLRDKFFASHCKLFGNRPFIWHIWDGRKDGFSALVNYHKLDRKLLERLIYTTLQSWIDRQKAEADRGTGGAEARLVAATELKRKLELILEGEPPYDIYLRWKPLSQQPIGWDPDINDGVRLNVRPFVTAGVLRAKFNVKWEKDRGKNPDGSERLNDLHYTVAQKRDARAGRSEG